MSKDKFILYEYLKFFWERKLILILVPILVTILFGGVYQLFFHEKSYIGKASVYTGSINTDDVTNPNNLIGKFEKEIDSSLEISMPSYGYIDIRVEGKSEELVDDDLNFVTNQVKDNLVEKYELRLNTTLENVESLQFEVEELQTDIENYSEIINDLKQSKESELGYYGEILLWSLEEHSIKSNSIRNMKNDIAFFEKPEILQVSHQESKSYIVEVSLIGFILGAIIVILLLILLKYISDARSYRQLN